MDGDTLYTIGELARRTGLPVRTIRFYSDAGVVPPADRTDTGYRLYDLDAVARLDLVRTLRELGVDLATVQRVLAREITVSEVAAAHAEALDVQIRTLRLRRAVMRAVAKHRSGPEEMELMHKLAKLSDEERRRIITDFIDEAYAGLDADPAFAAKLRSAMPELPDDPQPEQVAAWVELAELVQDPGFKARIRQMIEYQAANPVPADQAGGMELAEVTQERVEAARAAGIAPESAEAAPVVDGLVAAYAAAFGATDDAAYRRLLLERMEIGNDRRAERYWQLLATINGWPSVPPTLTPVFEWFIAALRAHS
ncbi:MerR family transcriptional regulator [Actinomadura rugatobispora]|uniref:MerR family transcriptional regulator n=1 Tax=Actinomadura rugatobispora TaxID=1994 RepID=A0ABW0ZTE2_9ACTN|nr:MerR family transcriptional regulator [Actinomadura rugatobispora]